MQLIEGDAEGTVAAKEIERKPGQILLLQAEKSHAVKAVTRF